MNCKILLLVSIRERERGRERERERERSGSVEDGGGREPSTIAGVGVFRVLSRPSTARIRHFQFCLIFSAAARRERPFVLLAALLSRLSTQNQTQLPGSERFQLALQFNLRAGSRQSSRVRVFAQKRESH